MSLLLIVLENFFFARLENIMARYPRRGSRRRPCFGEHRAHRRITRTIKKKVHPTRGRLENIMASGPRTCRRRRAWFGEHKGHTRITRTIKKKVQPTRERRSPRYAYRKMAGETGTLRITKDKRSPLIGEETGEERMDAEMKEIVIEMSEKRENMLETVQAMGDLSLIRKSTMDYREGQAKGNGEMNVKQVSNGMPKKDGNERKMRKETEKNKQHEMRSARSTPN